MPFTIRNTSDVGAVQEYMQGIRHVCASIIIFLPNIDQPTKRSVFPNTFQAWGAPGPLGGRAKASHLQPYKAGHRGLRRNSTWRKDGTCNGRELFAARAFARCVRWAVKRRFPENQAGPDNLKLSCEVSNGLLYTDIWISSQSTPT